MFVHDFLRKHLLEQLGYFDPEETRIADLDELKKSEWSKQFERLMRNRLIMGAIRYGRLNAPGKARYDRITSIEQRLSLYRETKNAEHLVDCANLCMLEFEEPSLNNVHFNATDDAIHTKKL